MGSARYAGTGRVERTGNSNGEMLLARWEVGCRCGESRRTIDVFISFVRADTAESVTVRPKKDWSDVIQKAIRHLHCSLLHHSLLSLAEAWQRSRERHL